jgi:hypothetical protein
MFRVSFEGVPVFLCTFHVLQAWLKNIRCKRSNKARAKEVFETLYFILHLKAVRTSEDRGPVCSRPCVPSGQHLHQRVP